MLIVDTPDHIDQLKIPAKAMTILRQPYRRLRAHHSAPAADMARST